MNKSVFLKRMQYEDKILLSNLFQKAEMAKKINQPTFSSGFYPPNLWMSIMDMSKELEIGVYASGIFEQSERRMICFSDYEVEEYPIRLIKVVPKSNFSELLHRDYLGALMALGIKREKFGDLLVKENVAYLSVMEEICEYICENWIQIGKSPCTLEIIEYEKEKELKSKFEEIYVNLASLRLDDLTSALSHTSRAKAVEYVKAGKVLVNYKEVQEKSYMVKANSTITIRGIGKFVITDEVISTNKGRIRVQVKKYV